MTHNAALHWPAVYDEGRLHCMPNKSSVVIARLVRLRILQRQTNGRATAAQCGLQITFAASAFFESHQHAYITILWAYVPLFQ